MKPKNTEVPLDKRTTDTMECFTAGCGDTQARPVCIRFRSQRSA